MNPTSSSTNSQGLSSIPLPELANVFHQLLGELVQHYQGHCVHAQLVTRGTQTDNPSEEGKS